MTQGKNEHTKKQKIFWIIPILLFLVFIAYMMIRSSSGEVRETVAETHISTDGFETLSESLEGVLEEESYDIVTRDDWFLGAHGKWVGIYYAGTEGHTDGVSAEVSNVTIRKGIFEDE